MFAVLFAWVVRLLGWGVLLGGLSLGCASQGRVCVDWNAAVASEVHDFHDVEGE